MAKIIIRVGDPTASPAGPGDVGVLSAALVARARQLLGDDGSPPSSPVRHELRLGLDGSPTEVEVTPGLWGVELVLPSGELLNEQVSVRQGARENVTFDLGEPPQMWLDWQFFEGSVPGRQQYQTTLANADAGLIDAPSGALTRSRPALRPAQVKAFWNDFPSSPVVPTDSFAGISGGKPRKNRSQVTVLRFQPGPVDQEDTGAGLNQRALVQWRTLVEALKLDANIMDLPGLREDEQWSFDLPQTDPWLDVWRLGSGPADTDRRFARVVTNGAVEFVSLPLPWPNERTQDQTQIELVIDKRDGERPSRIGVTLHDPRYFGLLSYLKNGALSLAGSVAEGGPGRDDMLVETLQEKRRNPLAACAAGYGLLGSHGRNGTPRWVGWLANLSKWFPEIPDGAILHARWMMLNGKAEPAAVRQEYLRAFRRGLPYYSLGLAWLLEGLRQFEDDEACAEAARLVRQVSLRSDVGQVFTVLSLHAPADLPITRSS